MSDKKRFGNAWSEMSRDAQWQVIEKLRETEDPLELNAWLEQQFALDPDRRDAIAKAHLPEGYGRLGPTALTAMIDELKAEVIPEAEAAKRAGYDHALLDKGEAREALPKYQEILSRRIPPGSGEAEDPYDVRMGRITNPTVHIGLNQLQRVINALIRRYGKPDQIAIELARDLKLGDKQKEEFNRLNARNRRDAERRSQQLAELSVEDNGYNRVLLKLWEELASTRLIGSVSIAASRSVLPPCFRAKSTSIISCPGRRRWTTARPTVRLPHPLQSHQRQQGAGRGAGMAAALR